MALKNDVAKTLQSISQGLESGSFGDKPRIALTIPGSEHGESELIRAAKMAKELSNDYEVVLIGGERCEGFEQHKAVDMKEAHQVMEELFESDKIDGAVTLHYNFPLGVSTVGKVVTPATGRDMILTTTTGTSHPARVASMIKNAVYGVIVAESLGIKSPRVGILNVEGASSVERGLNRLKEGGFSMNFAESARSDGGIQMRGNDLLQGTPDVMVTDTLTGNLLVKMFASFLTGGGYEATGYGYGPAIGEEFPWLVSIISRASGAPVIANAIKMTADAVKGGIQKRFEERWEEAKRAGLDEIIESLLPKISSKESSTEVVKVPPKKIVNEELFGIDILDIEDATQHLWKSNIYAESGMGCTGPVVMVAKEDEERSKELLKEGKFL